MINFSGVEFRGSNNDESIQKAISRLQNSETSSTKLVVREDIFEIDEEIIEEMAKVGLKVRMTQRCLGDIFGLNEEERGYEVTKNSE